MPGKTGSGILSEEDLNLLLDRSPDVFADRTKGWTSTDKQNTAHGNGDDDVKKPAAFEVFEGTADEGNDALARMLGEDIE